MGFFATIWAWLHGEMTSYVGDNTARLAGILEPAVVTLATLYVMAWGYLHLLGKIQEPISEGLKRIALIALVLGAGLRLWLYNSVIVSIFYDAPSELAAAMTGATDPIGTIDAIWNQGGAVADFLFSTASGVAGTFGSYLAAMLVWCFVGLLCVYTLFLLALTTIASAVLLALGPLFIALALFGATRRMFTAWLAQLTHYALVNVLTVAVTTVLLQLVRSYAEQTAARGQGIHTVDALDLVLVVGVAFLILRQVMPIAGSLAGGVALQTSMGTLSGMYRETKQNVILLQDARRRARQERAAEAKSGTPARDTPEAGAARSST